jgi:hypothetical protein
MAHVTSAVVPEHVFAVDLQSGSVMHVHFALPTDPVQAR